MSSTRDWIKILVCRFEEPCAYAAISTRTDPNCSGGARHATKMSNRPEIVQDRHFCHNFFLEIVVTVLLSAF
jgi:hypothetical protein